jgi:enoyl-CoA hydratase
VLPNQIPAISSDYPDSKAEVVMADDKKFETILVEAKDGVGLIQLNRPKALNALNKTLLSELMDMLETFDRDDAVGAIVITGSNKAFAAGADIKQMAGASAVEMHRSDFIPIFDRILSIRKPLIAAVSGWCLGGGNELAMSCDMIVASETAKFGQPEINLGVIPGAGGTQRLAKAVGKAIAMEMVLNNRTLNAQEALDHGLVNYIAPLDAYLDKALTLAAEIATRAPLAVQLGKEAVNQAFETPLSKGLAHERRAFNFLFATDDQKEGMAAFIEKRSPEWKGK